MFKSKQSFIFLFAFLVSGSIQASAPNVGDWVSFNGTHIKNGQVGKSKWTQQILALTPFQALIKFKEFIGSEQWVDLHALNYINDINSFCRSGDSGEFTLKLESLITPAGTFTTCKVETNNYTAWYSDVVPFGLVKELQKFDDGSEFEKLIFEFGNSQID
jgi:hypothetical protein